MVLTDAVYTTVSGTPWVPPNYPGAVPIIPPQATQAQIGELVRQHGEALREWKEYTNMQAALKKQLIASVDPIYLRAIRNRHVGFNQHTVRDILQHLLMSYGNISAADLDKNTESMKAPWDPSQPFEVLIDQIEEAVTYADAGNQPFTDQQILNTAYMAVFKSGLFFDDCKSWRMKPEGEKTWANFKTHFTDAYTQHRIQQDTMQAAGYHGANFAGTMMQEEAVEALANLATATAADRETMANLTNTVANLTKQLALKEEEIATLKKQLSGNNRQRKPKAPTAAEKPDNGNYCWTHGYKVAADHNSGLRKLFLADCRFNSFFIVSSFRDSTRDW